MGKVPRYTQPCLSQPMCPPRECRPGKRASVLSASMYSPILGSLPTHERQVDFPAWWVTHEGLTQRAREKLGSSERKGLSPGGELPWAEPTCGLGQTLGGQHPAHEQERS